MKSRKADEGANGRPCLKGWLFLKVIDLPQEEWILPGHRLCAGCAAALAYRIALKALGPNTIVTVPASCITVLHGMYPVTSVKIPCLNTAFETSAASASGIEAGLKALGREGVTVMSWAGDGGTYDIGIQALSGAAERGANILHVCYDNEAYMNTGTQRSGATPLGTRTTTTPVQGKKQQKKDMVMIMLAHGVSYLATATPAYPLDLFKKFQKAATVKGTRYIEILCPCPPGWGFETHLAMEMGRLAVRAGVFPLLEGNGEGVTFHALSRSVPKREAFDEYVKGQGRFKSMKDEDIELLWQQVLSRRERMLKVACHV